jgi:3-hydroxyisobutyrate dehydrogenase-like beta-hydroxyacid dehydrogenase
MARGLDLDLPLATLTAALEDGLMANGHGDEDVSVLARAVGRAGAGRAAGDSNLPV